MRTRHLAAGQAERQVRGGRPQAALGAAVAIAFAVGACAADEDQTHNAVARHAQTGLISQARPAQLTPGDTFRDCGAEGLCPAWLPEMVVLPAGEFLMGSPLDEPERLDHEGPQQNIAIDRFAASRFEVTHDHWDACVERTNQTELLAAKAQADEGGSANWIGCAAVGDGGFGRGGRPVLEVSWRDAQGYVRWLNQLTVGDADAGPYRLLTEAEWEYAARAGTGSAYPWGERASHEHANYGTDGCCAGFASGRDEWVNTAPVGSFPANDFGLHDMHGNVWELVEDCYRDTLDGQDPNGAAFTESSCSTHVLRGGAWDSDTQDLRTSRRSRAEPTFRNVFIGFRVARSLR